MKALARYQWKDESIPSASIFKILKENVKGHICQKHTVYGRKEGKDCLWRQTSYPREDPRLGSCKRESRFRLSQNGLSKGLPNNNKKNQNLPCEQPETLRTMPEILGMCKTRMFSRTWESSHPKSTVWPLPLKSLLPVKRDVSARSHLGN